jgi:hypothetical protein
VIERTDEPACLARLAARQPQDFGVDLVASGGGTIAVPVVFDHGAVGLASADVTKDGFDFKDERVTGRLAYFLPSAGRWSGADVARGVAAVASDAIPPDTEVYFRPRNRGEVLVVVRVVVKTDPPRIPDWPACAPNLPSHGWITYVDAANPASSLDVKDPPGIVEPNVFGLIVVRHSEQLQPTFDSSVLAKLELPGIRDMVPQSGDTSKLGPNVKTRGVEPPKYICTTYRVAPRGAGGFTLTLGLIDPTKPTIPVGQRKLDVIVRQRFSGAFRAGIAGIFGAKDQKFEARAAPDGSQAEIVRTEQTPIELVLGHSIYFSGLGGGRGRSYFAADGAPVQDSHAGLFLGFGAVSVGQAGVDFLKSLHLGLEWEVSPYLAIAVTGVLRRVDELAAGAVVGGPAGMTIPTQSHYVPGAAVVVNITPSFFRFASGVGR